MVRPERFELPTFWFVARRSIQLSYGRTVLSLLILAHEYLGLPAHGATSDPSKPKNVGAEQELNYCGVEV